MRKHIMCRCVLIAYNKMIPNLKHSIQQFTCTSITADHMILKVKADVNKSLSFKRLNEGKSMEIFETSKCNDFYFLHVNSGQSEEDEFNKTL